MLLDKLNEFAKKENLTNKYLVELFYDDEDFEGYWQETARFSSATDALNFLDCDLLNGLNPDLIGGLRILDIETDEVVYEINYREIIARRRVA
jgi:hypothetical protein